MSHPTDLLPDWITRGKTIAALIEELQTFEDQNLTVFISVDGGDTLKPISLVSKQDGACFLTFEG